MDVHLLSIRARIRTLVDKLHSKNRVRSGSVSLLLHEADVGLAGLITDLGAGETHAVLADVTAARQNKLPTGSDGSGELDERLYPFVTSFALTVA